MRFGRRGGFWVLVVTLVLLLFASSAPSPLYVVYQSQWGFSDITLTSVFAVYAIALLVTLVTAGSVSDHVGRRPALVRALVLEIIVMAIFAEARSVEWLFAARILQGVATGIAMGTGSAALLDLQPPDRPRWGALAGVAAPLAGLALGALVASVLAQYAPDPTRLIYWCLFACFTVLSLLVTRIPETVHARGPWVGELSPEMAVPRSLRTAFIATIPCIVAVWALGGLVLSLAPSLVAVVLGHPSHLAGGMPIFIMSGVSAIASVLVVDAHARTTARGGLIALIAGVALVLVGLEVDSIAVFYLGSGIAGFGFGPAFAGAFRALTARAPSDQRAAFTSSVFTVSYLAFSVPAVAAGVAATRIGLESTALVYGGVLMALAAVAVLLSGHLEDPQSSPERAEATTTADRRAASSGSRGGRPRTARSS